MGVAGDLWALAPRSLRTVPADLAAVVLVTLGFDATLLVAGGSPVQVALGALFVVAVPGYALVAALYPAGARRHSVDEGRQSAPDRSRDRAALHRRGRLTGVERAAFSIGVSVAVGPLLGVALDYTPLGIRAQPFLLALSAITVLAAVVARRRRQNLPADERFRVPVRAIGARVLDGLVAPPSRTDALLNVLVVAGVVAAVGSVGFVLAVQPGTESFTEFYLLSGTGDGEFVADDYPTEFVRGESKAVVIGVENHLDRTVNYAVVVELQRLGPRDATVREQQSVGSYRTTVEDGGTARRQFEVTPAMTGERLRLAFLLYRGAPPADPTVGNAHHSTHLWVSVSPRGADGGTG